MPAGDGPTLKVEIEQGEGDTRYIPGTPPELLDGAVTAGGSVILQHLTLSALIAEKVSGTFTTAFRSGVRPKRKPAEITALTNSARNLHGAPHARRAV